MRIPPIDNRDFDLLVATSLLLASKFNEIDYNLPSFDYLKNSERLGRFWRHFSWREYIEFEKLVLKTLDWNLSQITTYQYLQALLSQGIVLSHEKVKVDTSAHDSEYSDKKEEITKQESSKFWI